jgi:hypothetical protein
VGLIEKKKIAFPNIHAQAFGSAKSKSRLGHSPSFIAEKLY